MDKNQGYEIIQAVMLENGRGFALGHNPAAPSPYVTRACYDHKDGQRQYEWGHYGPAFTSITLPSALWTLGHSPSRPVTPRMRSSTTISASRLKMDHFWRGGI